MSLSPLKMGFHRFATLPDVQLPAGYALRVYQPGDEQAWIDLLNRNGELGEWTDERREKEWQGGMRIPPTGLHFITWGDLPVATANVTLHPNPEEPYELGWVAVDPEHRGLGLGRQVCLAVLHHLRRQGCRFVFLLTNDHRLPAIRVYLGLGFEPLYTHPSHPERWRIINARLAERHRSP